MKIILFSIGTRGDVEPFLTVGEMLKNEGHQVICSFPDHFRPLADDAGLAFSPLSKAFLDLIEGDDAKMAMGGKVPFHKKIRAYIRLYKLSEDVNKTMLLEQKALVDQEMPDRIVYGGKAIYPILWGMDNPKKSVFLSPVPYVTLYTKDHAHIGFNGNYGPWLNKLTYKLANFGLIKHVVATVKAGEIGISPSKKAIDLELHVRKMIYMFSSSLIPTPDYWPSNAKVLGFHERNKATNWQPDPALLDFLEAHKKVVFITFGSMTNPEPEENTTIFINALQKHKIPAIINTFSGGLCELETYDHTLIHYVNTIPYDWIFPKVHGVIHHGGAGTTQMALKYGCASMVIPHIIDQFVWNDVVSNLGVGPVGIKVSKLTEKKLEVKLLDLYENEAYKEKAKEIRDRMAGEDWKAELIERIITV